ncbi:DUF4956 domain-containing protein [Myceligenerans indicum]|uniref:DUF4956 domain-containing protein n=1 Tax=Myceligenerans indicum TaxID=2593663 RepID=A0ABS1LR66_9MICO|nr:DUF4956 domain-containing protein [Myceligenerans indicum]MBL0888745.1 DUF4956 domain-containing protein [Myceligenerans indicum]
MSPLVLYAVDLVAVVVLVLALYFPRHRRRDLVVAFLLVNVGVLAVSSALAASTVAAGLGLGLFGVLSIIRLRSLELAQHEVAYYFAALALGLLGGLGATTGWYGIAGSLLIIAIMAVADHPRFLARAGHETRSVVLDQAVTDQALLVARLESLLGGPVHAASVRKLDLVNDTTLVDVRFSPASRVASTAAGTSSDAAAWQGAGR